MVRLAVSLFHTQTHTHTHTLQLTPESQFQIVTVLRIVRKGKQGSEKSKNNDITAGKFFDKCIETETTGFFNIIHYKVHSFRELT